MAEVEDIAEEQVDGATEVADEHDSAGETAQTAGRHEQFVRHVTHPCLSPDGSLLACVITEHRGYPRAVQRPLGPRGAGATSPERDVILPVDGSVRKVRYSPNGRWLAVEIAPDGGEREQIWLVTTDSQDPEAYAVEMRDDATNSIVCWDHGRLAVSAFDDEGVAEGRLVDPETAEYTVIDRRMGGELVHVRDGAALFRVGARGHRELLRIEPDGRWWPLLPVDTGSTTDRGEVLAAGGDDQPTRMLVRSDHSADRARLLEVRSREQQSETVTLASRSDADLDRVEVSLDCSVAALMWNVDGRTEVELMDLNSSPPRVFDRPVLPTVMASSPSFTADGSLLALTVESLELPPRVVVYDVSRRSWTDPEPARSAAAAESGERNDGEGAGSWRENSAPTRSSTVPIRAAQLTPMVEEEPEIIPELVRYRARDGLEITGWLYRAPVSGPAPTVVFLHGGPEGQSRPGYNDIALQVVESGVSYFMPNVRGSGGAGRFFGHADDRYGRFAGIDDVEDALLHLIETGVTDPDRAIVSGRSYGGYLVNATLVRHAGRWRGGIAACGMSDLETFYRDTEPWIASAAYPKYGNPVQERELLREISPIHKLDRVDVPMLFVHGAHDTNVPVSETEQAADALRARGVPVDILLFEDEGHEFVKLANRQLLGDRVVAFCQEVLDVQT